MSSEIDIRVVRHNPSWIGQFEYQIIFSISGFRLPESDNDSLKDVCEWVSTSFSRNFVILETATRIIAGGAVNNRMAWEEGWNDEDTGYSPNGSYELRCYGHDSTLFLLKYSHDGATYDLS